MLFKVVYVLSHETKNFFAYRSVTPETKPNDSFYLPRAAVQGAAPQQIVVEASHAG